jgi:hypothetical protein
MKTKTQKSRKPPISRATIIYEFLAAVAAVLTVLLLPGKLGFDLGQSTSMVLFTTCPVVSAIVVYLLGSRRNQTASFAITLAFSLLGLLPSPVAGYFLVPIGSVIGFNLTRKYKSPHAPENRNQKPKKPLLTFAAIAPQFFAGAAGTFVPALLGFLIAPNHPHGYALLFVGLLICTAPLLASAALIYLVATIGNQKGSFTAAFIGGFIGWCACILIAAVSLGHKLDSAGLSPWIAAGLIVTVTAVIGFNLTRSYKVPPPW